MAHIETVKFGTDINHIVSILDRDGCVVIEDVLDAKQQQQTKYCLDENFEKIPKCEGDFFGYETKRLSSLFKRSPLFEKMAINEDILKIMDHFLLKGCDQYQINLTQAISIGSGELPQIIHQDDPMFPFSHPDSEAMINCMWAIDDFTTENGATRLVPGSHKWPRVKIIDPEKMRLPKEEEIALGTMKAGSVLIYFGSLYHSGGQNKTNKPRIGAVISYCLGWLRQAENSYLAYTKEEVGQFTPRLQELLGYFVHKPNLGCVDGQNPISLVNGSSEDLTFREFIPNEAKEILKGYRQHLTKAA